MLDDVDWMEVRLHCAGSKKCSENQPRLIPRELSIHHGRFRSLFTFEIGIVRLDETHNVELSILHGTDVLFRFSGGDGQAADYCAEVFTWEISLVTDGSLNAFECACCRPDFPRERPIFRQQIRV